MEKLSEYLVTKGMTYEQFAEIIGSTATSVYRYANGLRIPEPEMMCKIYEATNGFVPPNGFYRLPKIGKSKK